MLTEYEYRFCSGSHSAASLSDFWCRLTLGEARVRFKRSGANSVRVSGAAVQRLLSWASERAKMCLMSVSLMLSNQGAGVGAVDIALGYHDAKFG